MTHTVAVIVGSLRKGSLNLQLAQVFETLAAGKLVFDYVEIGDLPAYNDDLWADLPAPVARLKEQVAKADAVLMLTPEYNRSYPGILKNALDWGSRPYGQGVWQGKPTAIAGTSPGAIGAAVGQTRLRADLASLSILLAPLPEVNLQWKPAAYDESGAVTCPDTRAFLQAYIDKFATFIAKNA